VMIVVYFSVLVAEVFGRAHIGEISGFLFAIASGGAAAGPYIAGLIFDLTSSYVGAFLLDAILVAIGLVCMLFIRKPQKQEIAGPQ